MLTQTRLSPALRVQAHIPSRALIAFQTNDLALARARAARLLAREHCGCCISPQVHLARFVGITLFLDDDPVELQRAIPSAERARWTVQVVAACIVLYGRARVTLYEKG
jgi:hypothetical protein